MGSLILVCAYVLLLSKQLCDGQTTANSTTDRSLVFTTPLQIYVNLLGARGYDYGLTPINEGLGVAVDLGIYVTNIGDINEADMQYGLNIYLRQVWMDHRLGFSEEITGVESISLPDPYYKQMWLPDTFIENGKEEQQHDVTLPNKLFRVYSNGTVYYSQRLSLDLWCPIDLANFPLDRQRCQINLMTYRYSTREMSLRWMEWDPVDMGNVVLSLFDLVNFSTGDCTFHYATGWYSCVYAEFRFKRRIGFYLANIYIPSALVVFLSWVSFWLEPTAVPARVSLGLLTILTMTQQMSTASGSLPKVSYVKAIDIWLTTCLSFLFAGLVEFAIVNSMSRRETLASEAANNQTKEGRCNEGFSTTSSIHGENGERTNGCALESVTIEVPSNEKRPSRVQIVRGKLTHLTATQVDWICRLIFPSVFAVFNIGYWAHYNN